MPPTHRFLPQIGVALSAVLVLACGAPSGRGREYEGTGRVAVVDVARILRDTERGREIMGLMQEAEGQAVSQLEDMRADLQAIAEEVETARAAQPPDEANLARLLAEYQEAAGRAQEAQGLAQARLEQYRQELTEPLVAEVRSVCEQIGRDDGYDLIVDRRGTAYVEDAIDITAQVVEELEGSGSSALVREVLRSSGGEDGEPAEDSPDDEPDEATPADAQP